MLKNLTVVFLILCAGICYADDVAEQTQAEVQVQQNPEVSVESNSVQPQQVSAPAQTPENQGSVSDQNSDVQPQEPQDNQKADEQPQEEAPKLKIKPPSEFSEKVEAMLQRNPFGQSSFVSAMSVAEENNGGFQLRSVYCVDKKWYFGIYEISAKKFYTLKMGERHSEDVPYIVDFYDDETQSVSFSTPLGTYTLTLKERDPLTGRANHIAAPSKAKAPVRVNTRR